MKLKELLLDALFPPSCLACGGTLSQEAKARSLCDGCLRNVRVHETLFCLVCRARLADKTRICHSATPLRLASVGSYGDQKLRTLITRLKYRRHAPAATALDSLLARYLSRLAYDFSGYTAIPVPLHHSKERKRGFNQSLILARLIASRLNLPLLAKGLIKTRPTLAQAQTENIRERVSNLSGCFSVPDPQLVADKKILLIDDVCTSGTTLHEAAQTLKKAGAKNIIGLVMAQTN